jgi:hypothetical protein
VDEHLETFPLAVVVVLVRRAIDGREKREETAAQRDVVTKDPRYLHVLVWLDGQIHLPVIQVNVRYAVA